jgi:hypothetical protein
LASTVGNPEALADLWKRYTGQRRESGEGVRASERVSVGTIPEGEMDAALFSVAYRARMTGAEYDEIVPYLEAWRENRLASSNTHTTKDSERLARSVMRYDPRDPIRQATEPEPPGGRPVDESSSWLTFLDLLLFDGLPPATPELSGLAYCGNRNLWSGPSESGKTWAAIAVAVDEIMAGRDVLWIDTDGMGEQSTLERLLVLGASSDAIRDHFRYIVPSDKLTRPVLDALLERLSGRLVVVDSFNATMSVHGLSFQKGEDVEAFWQLFDPFCRAGWAVVVLDHVTKATEGRGAYAIGSERKQSGAHAHLGFTVVGGAQIVREGTGRSALATNKDRGAYFERPTAGIFKLTISGGVGRWTLQPARGHEDWKPSGLMERVSVFVEGCALPPSRKTVEDNVKGKADYVRQAIDRLVKDGYLREIEGARGARQVESLKPYREDDDSDLDDLVPTSSPNGTNSSPEPLEPTSSPRPPSIGDEDEDEGSTSSLSRPDLEDASLDELLEGGG